VRRVELVVFDLDGTLIDSAGDLAASVNATLERLAPGSPPLPAAQVRTFIGDGAAMLVTRTLAAAGVEVPTEAALPVFLDCYEARLLDTTVLYPGVVEALDALRDRTLAVLTNKPGAMSRRILAGLGVEDRFARVAGAGDVPAKKPDPAGLRLLLAETGIPPESAVLVGDSAIDVRTGRAAGVRTVGVTYGLDPSSLRAAPPDITIGDLRELAPRLARPFPVPTVLP
jgi:phosphoglycolate phosphatase